MQLRGMPYVAGVVRGVLRRGMEGDPSGHIVLLRQAEIRPFTVLPAGFIVVDGAPFAHAMIPLLGAGVPAIIISSEQAADLSTAAEVVLDGATGLVTTDVAAALRHSEPARSAACARKDGADIGLRVSVRDLHAVQRAVLAEADAIGLVRSEFLLPTNGRVPDLDFYRCEFRALCEAAAPLPVTIRLLDIGGDKLPGWLPPLDGIGGALGLQGVRLFSHEPVRGVYRAQLAAIDELSSDFDIRLLIPYLASREELLEWTGQVRQALSRPLPLGAMAETPAAALQIADWLELADFVALGCNDLMQCLFGANRDRYELRRYLDPYAPSLFRFLRQVADAASDHLDRLQLCGVLPQLPGILPLLLGLGFRLFSVEAASLDYLRRTIGVTSIADATRLVQAVCAAHDSNQVRKLLAARSASGTIF